MALDLPDAASLGVASIEHRITTTSTMDDAHDAAEDGIRGGTLFVADTQRAGRGRAGRQWISEPGAGLWMTLLERPGSDDMLHVLTLRLGMALAQVLDPFVAKRIRLKWPNDLFVGERKLAGVLVEARWRDVMLDSVAIGVGVNMRVPRNFPEACAVRRGVTRAELLIALVPKLRAAARVHGDLSDAELTEWRSRDLAVGRRATSPKAGVVQGIRADGSLLIKEPGQAVVTGVRSGSLLFADQ